MFCTTCGMKNAADSNFCKQCGHQIDNTISGRVREEDFDRALPEDEQLNALLERAYRARKAGDSAQAISLCQEALALRPDSTTAHSLLGQVYESQGDHEMAIRQYERVLQLNPGSIADRVKLDELRDGGLLATRGSVPPHIVFTDQKFRQSGSQVAAWVALGGVLMLIGGLFALRLYGHPAPAVTTPIIQMPANLTQGPQNSGIAGGNTAQSGTGNDAQKSMAANAQPAYNPYLWSMPPPIIVQPAADTRARTEPGNSNDNSGRMALATVPLPAPGKADKDGRHIFLAPPDDGTDGGSVVIDVGNDKGKSGTPVSAPHSTSPASSEKVTVSDGNQSATGNGGNSQPASYDARSFIAAGDEHRQSGDYDKALQSYTKALASAGDDLASVYQQIARCHQLRGDKTSAIANYKSAITEYHKLIDAKKQAEFAEDGIRVCEKAIKACNY